MAFNKKVSQNKHRNSERKARYSQMSLEGVDKETRNKALTSGLESGAENITIKGKKIKVKELDPKTGKVTRTFYRVSDVLKRPKMPVAQAGGKSSKRARLKASRSRLVKNFKHLNRCGNVGCSKCHPGG